MNIILIARCYCVFLGGVTKEGLSSEVWCTSLGEDDIVWTNLQSSGLPPIGIITMSHSGI